MRVWFFGCNIQGEIGSQKLQDFWLAKALMSSYILCEILRFSNRVAQKAFIPLGSNSLRQLTAQYPFNLQSLCSCSSIRNGLTSAKEANIVNKEPRWGRFLHENIVVLPNVHGCWRHFSLEQQQFVSGYRFLQEPRRKTS